MYFITIDYGNHHPHVGLFHGKKRVGLCSFAEFCHNRLWEKAPFAQAPILYSDVGGLMQQTWPFQSRLLSLRNEVFAAMPVHYAQTLGDDRLYTAFATYQNCKGKQLVIDAGTFITLDVVSPKGALKGFSGGYIYPGQQLLLQLFQKGRYLPEVAKVDLMKNHSHHLPQTTPKAMTGALQLALTGLLQQVFKEHGPFAQVTITGGDADLIKKMMKKNWPQIKTVTKNHLVHTALSLAFDLLKNGQQPGQAV